MMTQKNKDHLENLRLWLECNVSMDNEIVFSNEGEDLETTSTEALEALSVQSLSIELSENAQAYSRVMFSKDVQAIKGTKLYDSIADSYEIACKLNDKFNNDFDC